MIPLADTHYLRETDPDGRDGRSIIRTLASLRDEIMAISMSRHGGRSRELALVATKLDEARQWAISYGESIGTISVIDRKELLGRRDAT